MEPEVTLSEIYPNDHVCIFDSITLNITPKMAYPHQHILPSHHNSSLHCSLMDAKLFRQVPVHSNWLVYIIETCIGRYMSKSPNTRTRATNIT
jgi:hypothetical protein